MKYKANHYLLGSALVVITSHWSISVLNAENDIIEAKMVELISLELNYEIDLRQIFMSHNRPAKQLPPTENSKTSPKSHSLELVGTLILDKTKIAWLKVDGQLFQLKSGQIIPGLPAKISKINPESVVLDDHQSCQTKNTCDFSITLMLREALF